MCILNFVGTIKLNFNYINNTVVTIQIYSLFLKVTNQKNLNITNMRKEKKMKYS